MGRDGAGEGVEGYEIQRAKLSVIPTASVQVSSHLPTRRTVGVHLAGPAHSPAAQ